MQGSEPGVPDTDTATANGGHDPGRWRLSNWRLRTKVLAVLLIPTVTALVLAGLRGVSELRSQQSLELTATQVDVAGEISTVVDKLQRERFLAVAKTASATPGTDPNLQRQTASVDSAVVNLRKVANTLEGEDPAVRNRYDQGLQRLESLNAVRSAVNGTAYPPAAVYDVYSSIITDLIQLGRQVNAAVTDRELLRSSDVLQSLSEAKDYGSRLDAVLQIASTSQRFDSGLLNEARADQASFEAAQTAFESNATPDERQLYSDIVSGPEVDSRERQAETAFSRADEDAPLTINPIQLSNDSAGTTAKLRSVQVDLLDNLRANASALANAAQQAALRDAAIVLTALLAALVLVVLVVRSLLRPLRMLRTSALDLAYRRLPEEVNQILADANPLQASKAVVRPVPVFSREETGEVARSFDEVHERAVALAAEQALLRESVNAMFVNLSRRSQTLVERQLALIDRLEADEQDPDQLSSLFELDHLATRMRRNSENLLVLSGTDLGRRLNKGVQLNDVIGAAVSEIEQYTRVQVAQAPDFIVAGGVVNDLVHLIAELLDNATLFSNPETQVTVRAAKVRSGAVGIEVTDRGVGIQEAEMAAFNERLADPPELDVSVSRRMGLYVVARLAKRHGVRVQLRDNQDLDGGVIAKVVIPQQLVHAGESPSMTDTGFAITEDTSGGGATTGGFAAVPDSAEERSSPAMASSGLARAFNVNRDKGSNAGSNVNANGSRSYDPGGMQSGGMQSGGMQSGSAGQTGLTGQTGFSGQSGFSGPAGFSGRTGFSERTGFSGQTVAAGQNGYRPDEDLADDELLTQDDGPGDEREDEATLGQYEQGRYEQEPYEREPYEQPFDQEDSLDQEDPRDAGARYPQEKAAEMDVPTDRLPIYEAVLSQWFSTDPDPAGWQAQAAPSGGTQVASSEPAEASSATGGLPKRVPGHNSTDSAPAPHEAGAHEAVPQTAEQAWSSPADEGWHAAEALSEPVDETTSAGLPKRRPKAHLVPGSAAPRQPESSGQRATGEAAATSRPANRPATVPRSADAVRGRMSSLQQGVRRGRHSLTEPANGSDDPER
jgi:signal transduction histidine kinase